MAMKQKVDKFRTDLTKQLKENKNPVTDALGKIEEKTGVDRFFIVCGAFAIFALYMVFGFFAELVCNTIGFLYPAYLSMKAIESVRKDDDTQWLTYWVIFATFSVLEFFADAVVGWFPLYWLAKCVVMLWLYLPQFRGAEMIYKKYIRPFVLKHQSAIDKGIHEAKGLKDKVIGETNNLMDDFQNKVQ